MTKRRPAGSADAVRVPAGLHLQSRFFSATRSLWRRLAELETAAVREEIEALHIDRPIYVTSLPRSGTTIVTEMLEHHPQLTAHHYSDFPNVWTPYWRNYLLQRTRRQRPAVEERAHRDRIQVSIDSPEAVEEVLWMHFFPDFHREHGHSGVLDGSERHAAFDAFYRDHIRKLLAVRGASRYLAKGNYNLARIGYLLTLFPDARFLIPVRNPVDQVASLEKQHQLFSRAAAHDSRVAIQLSLAGHFEFGPKRRPVSYGDEREAEAIRAAWDRGDAAEGWSRYWALSYGYVLDLLESDERERNAALLIPYERLCEDSEYMIDRILEHCELPREGFEQVRARYSEHLQSPDYYAHSFSPEQVDRIRENCAPVLERLRRWMEKTV